MEANTATIITHAGARKVPFEVLQALPHPESLGRRHKPVPHVDLVKAIQDEAVKRSLEITRQEFAITQENDRLFALFTFKGGLDGMGWSLGVRNSVDQDFAIRGVGGARVFICDNLALSGSEFLFARKNTTGVRVREVVAGGFDKYLPALARFDNRVKELQATVIADNAARVAIYKAFVEHKVAALRLLPAVDEAYFKHGVEQPGAVEDVYPEVTKTVWGVHNAFTRVLKGIESPMAQEAATRRLGKVFAL